MKKANLLTETLSKLSVPQDRVVYVHSSMNWLPLARITLCEAVELLLELREHDHLTGLQVWLALSVPHLLAFHLSRASHRCRRLPPHRRQICHAQRIAGAYQTEPGRPHVESRPRYLPQPEGGRHCL